jgi:hypothetical protein
MYTDRDGKKASAMIVPVWNKTNDIIFNTISFIDDHKDAIQFGV